jgi:hypothetical protein
MNSLDTLQTSCELHTAKTFLARIKERADKAGALGLATLIATAGEVINDAIGETARLDQRREADEAAIFNAPAREESEARRA